MKTLFDSLLELCAKNFSEVFTNTKKKKLKIRASLPHGFFDAIHDKCRNNGWLISNDLLTQCFQMRDKLKWQDVVVNYTVPCREDLKSIFDAKFPLKKLSFKASSDFRWKDIKRISRFEDSLVHLEIDFEDLLIRSDRRNVKKSMDWKEENDDKIKLPNLRRLVLTGLNMHVYFFDMIDAKSASEKLRVLKLTDRRAFCDWTTVFDFIKQCRQLVTLSLCDCILKSGELDRLFDVVKSLPNLKTLALWCVQCFEVNSYFVELSELLSALPNLIHLEFGNSNLRWQNVDKCLNRAKPLHYLGACNVFDSDILRIPATNLGEDRSLRGLVNCIEFGWAINDIESLLSKLYFKIDSDDLREQDRDIVEKCLLKCMLDHPRNFHVALNVGAIYKLRHVTSPTDSSTMAKVANYLTSYGMLSF